MYGEVYANKNKKKVGSSEAVSSNYKVDEDRGIIRK